MTSTSICTDLRADLSRQAFRALNRVVVPAVKRGIGSPLPVGIGLVVLETTGRKSGLPREVPLVAARLGDTVMTSTVRPRSLWTRNVEATPEVAMWVGGRRRDGSAHVERGSLTVATVSLDD